MRRFCELYFKLTRVLLAALLMGMVVLVFGNVVLRYAFNSGLTISEELSRIFFVWIIFLGATVALAEHGHIGIDFVIKNMPRPVAKAMSVVGSLIVLGCCMLMLSGSYTQSEINLSVVTPVLGWSMTVYYGAGLFFAVVAIIIIVVDVWRVLADRPAFALGAPAREGTMTEASPAAGDAPR
jgi:TRAP-type C4-dicarboxylate transport system permease small subunit